MDTQPRSHIIVKDEENEIVCMSSCADFILGFKRLYFGTHGENLHYLDLGVKYKIRIFQDGEDFPVYYQVKASALKQISVYDW